MVVIGKIKTSLIINFLLWISQHIQEISIKSLNNRSNTDIKGLYKILTPSDHFILWSLATISTCSKVCILLSGYGFVDFESPQAAEVAVGALQAQGIQAQMAKVGIPYLHIKGMEVQSCILLLKILSTWLVVLSLHWS